MQQTREFSKILADRKLWLGVLFCLIQAFLTFIILTAFPFNSPSPWIWIATLLEALLALTVPALITFAMARQSGKGPFAGFFTGLCSTGVIFLTSLVVVVRAIPAGDSGLALLAPITLLVIGLWFAIGSFLLGLVGELIGASLAKRVGK